MASAGAEKAAAGTWRTAGALALALLVTGALVAAVVSQVMDGPAELAFGAQGSYLVTQGSPAGAQKLASTLPGSLVEDGNGTAWSVQTVDVEIFHDSYLSPDGKQVTVKSADGSKVVAPGTAGSYEFSARNATDVDATYDLSLEAIMSMPAIELPLEGRMQSAGAWLVGGDDEWVPLREMGVIEDNARLGGHQAKGYRFEWRWPFERGGAAGDAEDMELDGREAGAAGEIDLSVRLQATASYDGDFSDGGDGAASPGSDPAASESPSLRNPSAALPSHSRPGGAARSHLGASSLPRTGDLVRAVPVAVAAAAASLLVLVVALLLRNRRDDGPKGGAGDE